MDSLEYSLQLHPTRSYIYSLEILKASFKCTWLAPVAVSSNISVEFKLTVSDLMIMSPYGFFLITMMEFLRLLLLYTDAV